MYEPKRAHRPFSRDRMNNANREAVAALCVHIFDRIQSYPRREEQLLAIAAAFLLVCRACKIEPSEVWGATNNIIYDPLHSDGMKEQFAGMAYYLQEDVLAR